MYALAWPQGWINRPRVRQYMLMSANIVPNICTGHLVSLVHRQDEITDRKYQCRGISRWQKLRSRGCGSKPRAVVCSWYPPPVPDEWSDIGGYYVDKQLLFYAASLTHLYVLPCSPDLILQSKMMVGLVLSSPRLTGTCSLDSFLIVLQAPGSRVPLPQYLSWMVEVKTLKLAGPYWIKHLLLENLLLLGK